MKRRELRRESFMVLSYLFQLFDSPVGGIIEERGNVALGSAWNLLDRLRKRSKRFRRKCFIRWTNCSTPL
jgi:hypothetical protein